MNWEYTSVIAQGRTSMIETFVELLNEHGELGWEVCGIAIDKSAAVAILKRKRPGQPEARSS